MKRQEREKEDRKKTQRQWNKDNGCVRKNTNRQ